MARVKQIAGKSVAGMRPAFGTKRLPDAKGGVRRPHRNL